MVSRGGVVAVSAYMGGTRGPGVLSSAGDVLGMSVIGGVGGVCGMCLARGGRCRGERIEFWLYQSWSNMEKLGNVSVMSVYSLFIMCSPN